MKISQHGKKRRLHAIRDGRKPAQVDAIRVSDVDGDINCSVQRDQELLYAHIIPLEAATCLAI
jgi:hypothetical protein